VAGNQAARANKNSRGHPALSRTNTIVTNLVKCKTGQWLSNSITVLQTAPTPLGNGKSALGGDANPRRRTMLSAWINIKY